MTEDAKKYEADDKKRRELVDLRNQADQVVYTTEKTLKEHGEKVGPQERSNVEAALNNLREVMKGDDADAIKRAMENVMQASQEIGKKIYENVAGGQAQAGAAAGEGPQAGPEGGSKGGDDVIDAEYEEKK